MDVAEAVLAVDTVVGWDRNQCYPAAEAVYHLVGGKDAGLTPVVAKVAGLSHWWLRDSDGNVIDPTGWQYDGLFPYQLGRGCGFMTKGPSRRARAIIEQVESRR